MRKFTLMALSNEGKSSTIFEGGKERGKRTFCIAFQRVVRGAKGTLTGIYTLVKVFPVRLT